MAATFKDDTGAETVWKPDHAVVDICFVHGQGGGRHSTWTKDEVFWPYNLLPQDIPDARIITWGYNAEVAHFLSPYSKVRVRDHAKSLLNDLNGLRDSPETCTRPIIFVAHSLGGIVCAQSLLQSSGVEPDDVEKLSDHTNALAFMGTPFEGSDTTRWTGFFGRLSSLFPVVTINKTLLDHLKKDSHDLKILGEDFPSYLKNRSGSGGRPVHVACFFEERPTSALGHIVPRDSAGIVGHESILLPDNHVGICKFDNFEDPKYKVVLGILKKWVEEIRKAERGEDVEKPTTVQANITMGNNYGGAQAGQGNSTNSGVQQGQIFNIGSKDA